MTLSGSKAKSNLASLAGFTLIELILVMAITSLLAVIAFMGQGQVQSRARFDGAINQTVQDINYARNYALSNVNENGSGNKLVGPTGGPTEFAGASFVFNPAQAGGNLTLYDAVFALDNADGSLNSYNFNPYGSCGNPGQAPDCAATENTFGSLQSADYTIWNANGANWVSVPAIDIVYLNASGQITVCPTFSMTHTYAWDCSAANPNYTKTMDIGLKNSDGFKATIQIDPVTGYASRIN
jgi:prepilin-type N-terminal cleavage/methylation domain-containing protein